MINLEITMKPSKLTVFTFGYWGWGNHTKELVTAIDKAETDDGYRPPVFVDIRFKREARAIGFRGDAFNTLVGKNRYDWIKRLGNCNIGSNRPGIKIADPTAVSDLLDLALDAARENRRLIYFCACEIPKSCHRRTVAKLLRQVGRKQGINLTITEWPGGEPQQMELPISHRLFKSVERGRKSVPLPRGFERFRALPWYSIVNLLSGDETNSIEIYTGPARFVDGWCLPVLNDSFDPAKKSLTRAQGLSRRFGYRARY